MLTKRILIVMTMVILLSLVIGTRGCFKREKPAPQSGSSAQPGAFQTTLPADGVINVDVFSAPVPVAWSPSSNVTSYILEVAKDDDFASANMVYSATLSPNTTNHSITAWTLWGGIWYYWRVTAVNAYGTTVSSDTPSCFYTSSGGTIPGAFNLATPIDNDSGISLTPELNWTNAPKESKYIIYLDNDSNFSAPIYTDTARPGELNIQIPAESGLTETARYYWKVEAVNWFGNRSSSIYSFVTGPIKSYTITPTATTITAGNGVTMTITAYNSSNAVVTAHNPFTLTMNSGTGLTYYTNSALTIVNPTGTYTMTSGAATVYVKITLAGSVAITATDRAGRTKTCSPLTVSAGPVAAVIVTGPASITSGVESSSYTALSYDAYNNPVPDTYTWTNANGSGTGNLNVDKLIGVISGTVIITATSVSAPGKSGGQTVTVIPGAIATVTVAGSDQITSGIQSSSYTATSTDAAGNLVSDTYTWTKANGTGSATLNVDKLTGAISGTVTITATSVANSAKSGAKTVTVIPGAVNTVIVSGSTPITSGIESSSYTATSTDAAGNPVSDTYTWTKANGSGTGNLNVDKLIGALSGTVIITATSTSAPSKGGSQTVTVIPGAVNTVLVSGPTPITSGLESSSYTATSTDAAGNLVSDTYTWTKANGSGTGNLNVDKLIGVISGTVIITATSTSAPSKAGSQTVTVIPGAVATVVVSGPDPITSGVESSSFTAVSRDINNNLVSDTYTWTKSNGTGSANLNVDKLIGVISGTVVITATSTSAPSKGGSQTITVIPGAVNTVVVSGPDPITSGIESSSYTATSTDAAGNLVSDTYTWTKANGTGSANLNADKLTGILVGTVTITATSVAAPSKSGGKTVTVIPGQIDNYLVAASTPVGVNSNQTASVTARDVNLNTVTSANSTVTPTIIAISGTPSATFYTTGSYTTTTTQYANPWTSGVATIYYRATASADRFQMKVTDSAGKFGQSSTVIITGIASIAFLSQPQTATAGATMPAVTVEARDEFNNLLPGVDVSISATNGAALAGTLITTTDGSGVATFNDLSITLAGTNYTLSATTSGLAPLASNAFNITAGPVNNLVFAQEPEPTYQAGETITTTVLVRDQYNNPVSGTAVTITTTDGTLLNGQLAITSASNGIATFTPMSITLVGNYALSATAGAISATSTTLAITPDVPNNLVFVQQPPADTVAGAVIAPAITVRLRDQFNNLVLQSGVPVSVTTTTQLNGTTTTNTDTSGIATFNDLYITLTGTYVLTASAVTLLPANSNNFNITAAPANNLTFTAQPPVTATAGATTISAQVTVTDAYNNPVPNAPVSVTTTTQLNGTTEVNSDGSGVAAFSGLSITTTGTYQLAARAGAIGPVNSSNFDVTPAPADSLAFSTQPPASAVAGATTIAAQVTVTDAYNNLVPNAPVSVTTTTQLNGTTTVNSNGSGVAIFSGLYITTTGTYQLAARSGAIGPVNSSNLDITAAAAGSLAWLTQPQSATANATMSAFTLRVQDQYGNNVAGATVSITATDNTRVVYQSGVQVTAYATTNTDSSGIATFNAISMTTVGTGYAFTATAAALTPVVSNNFNITEVPGGNVYVGGSWDGWDLAWDMQVENTVCYYGGPEDGWSMTGGGLDDGLGWNEPCRYGGDGDGWDITVGGFTQ